MNIKNTKEIALFICDDELIWQQRIRKICESVLGEKWVGCTIATGKSGKEVLAYQGEIDILILDIRMAPAGMGIVSGNFWFCLR